MEHAVALYTGGKDSHYAIIEALREGITTDLLIIVTPRRDDSWMFHTVNIRHAELHAILMEKPYITVSVSGVKEAEVRELRSVLERLGLHCGDIRYLISGAVASQYQKRRVDSLCRSLGLEHVSPLWGRDQGELIFEEAEHLSFIITAVQAYGFSLNWLGRVVDRWNVEELVKDAAKAGISPVGEGGEFETFVIRSPLFKRSGVAIRKADIVKFPQRFTGYYNMLECGCPPS